MLKITIDATEYFDEAKSLFIEVPSAELIFEHSLFSISKWEAIHNKPLLGKDDMTEAETRSYIQCMIENNDVDLDIVDRLSFSQLKQIDDYIVSKQTATWFPETKGRRSGAVETITSELIYYWMVTLQIPFECQYWHIERLLTLIRVCNAKNQPAKKMSPGELAARNRDLNAQRRASMGTRG